MRFSRLPSSGFALRSRARLSTLLLVVWGTLVPVAAAQPGSPTITTTSLPTLHVLETFDATLAAGGGASPYTWTAEGLPGGLVLDPATGRLTNDPDAPAITSVPEGPVTVTVTDAQGASATAELPLNVVTVVRVAHGYNHTCAITSASTLYCWGDNLSGQLGIGSIEGRSLPTPVLDPAHPGDPSRVFSGAVDVAAGEGHTCALTDDGSVYCWGYNGAGRLGLGHDTPETIPVPSRVVSPSGGFFSGAVAVTAGSLHSCARTDDEVYCWGDNVRGQLGQPGYFPGMPTSVVDPANPNGTLGDVVSVSAGAFYTCAVTSAGHGYCWGWNNAGQLGIGQTVPSQSSVPLRLPDPANPTQPLAGLTHVSAGTFHTCAGTESGNAYCWGQNANGQLGHGNAPYGSPSPVLVVDPASPGVPMGGLQTLRVGNGHSCALTDDGGAVCWGTNSSGQLGNGGSSASDVPVRVADPGQPGQPLGGLVALGHRGWQTCALTNDGLPLCWGSNANGQLGDGTTENRNLPTPVHPRAVTAPVFTVTPSSIAATVVQGEVDVALLTLANSGGTALAWSVEQGEAGCALPGWVNANPPGGEIAPGGQFQLGVVLLGVDLAPGGYEAALCLASSDPARPLTTVPITLTVAGEGPALAFDPAGGLEVEVEAGGTTTGTVTLTNTGSSSVGYSFSGYDAGRTYANPANPLADVMPLVPRASDRSQNPAFPRHLPARGSGGPDVFGYTWIDSTEPGGPAFEALDISTSGQVLPMGSTPECHLGPGDEGIAEVDLPFSFHFYGETHTRLWVSTNGFIALQPVATCHFHASPFPGPANPTSASPGAMIAPLWLDMDTALGGEANVFTELLPDGRFVVQWNEFERLGEDVPNTFQAILSPGGTVTFQYLDINVVGDLFGGPQVGIQNHDGTAGLTVASGVGYAADGLAVRLSAPPAFVSGVEPAAGTLAPGASVDVSVAFDAEGLVSGVYAAALVVETDAEAYEYPVTLTVTGAGGLALSPDPLAFGDVVIGFAETRTLTVTSSGSASTTITGIEATDPAFSVAFSGPLTLAPGSSATVEVTYAPTAEGVATAVLQVASDQGPTTGALSGTGVRPPEAQVSAESLSLEVVAGHTASASLTLSNAAEAGAADLTFAARVEAAPARSARLVTPGQSRTLGEVEGNALVADGPYRNAAPAGEPYVDLSGPPFSAWRGGALTLTHSASSQIDETPGVGCAAWDDGYNRANRYYRVFDLSAFDIEAEFRLERVEVGVWMGHTDNLPATTVRLHTLQGALTPANLTLVAETEVQLTPSDHLGLVEATFPDPPVFTADEVVVVEWSVPDGIDAGHLVIAGYNTAGQTGPTYIQAWDCGAFDLADLASLGFPELHWVLLVHGTAMQPLLSVGPEGGVLAPGQSTELALTVDASDIEPGTYVFDVVLDTNDPARPAVTVPVTVSVAVVSAEDGAVPQAFALEPNYPNPFAHRTAIAYALPEAAHVRLTVYDATGRLVTTLVDADQPAGRHEVTWETRGLASGVYFYRIEAGTFQHTQRMVRVQ